MTRLPILKKSPYLRTPHHSGGHYPLPFASRYHARGGDNCTEVVRVYANTLLTRGSFGSSKHNKQAIDFGCFGAVRDCLAGWLLTNAGDPLDDSLSRLEGVMSVFLLKRRWGFGDESAATARSRTLFLAPKGGRRHALDLVWALPCAMGIEGYARCEAK